MGLHAPCMCVGGFFSHKLKQKHADTPIRVSPAEFAMKLITGGGSPFAAFAQKPVELSVTFSTNAKSNLSALRPVADIPCLAFTLNP